MAVGMQNIAGSSVIFVLVVIGKRFLTVCVVCVFFSSDFLGRTEVRMREVLEEARIKKGPITKRLILHEVDTGEVIVKLDLQLYEQ